MRNLRGGTGEKSSPSRGHNMNKEGRWQTVLVTFEGEEGPRGSWLPFPSSMIEPDVPGSFLHMGLMPKTWWTDSSFPWGCSLVHDLWQILDCHLLGSWVEQLVALEHSCHGPFFEVQLKLCPTSWSFQISNWLYSSEYLQYWMPTILYAVSSPD